MIDLHLHLLPGLDDGPIDEPASLALARAAVADGVSIGAATPHVRRDHPGVTVPAIAHGVRRFRALLAQEEIPLDVVAAAEVDPATALDLDDASLRALTYDRNGKDILLETPSGRDTTVFDAAIDKLLRAGFRVVAAHPERCRRFQRESGLLAGIADRGVLIQITASALIDRGSAASLTARRALAEGWVHLLASDAHGMAWRPPMLGSAAAVAGRLAPGGQAEARWLTHDVPAAVLAGTALPPRPSRPRTVRRWVHHLTG